MNKIIIRASQVVGGQATLAGAVGVSPSALNQWVMGRRPVPPERCPAIERATRGIVPVEEIRSDITWIRVRDRKWPHPEGRPCIDVVVDA
jgi:DNA-binding transcriptional regulator YdaS (Cro superfamily)